MSEVTVTYMLMLNCFLLMLGIHIAVNRALACLASAGEVSVYNTFNSLSADCIVVQLRC
jgi:hypothetical protein